MSKQRPRVLRRGGGSGAGSAPPPPRSRRGLSRVMIAAALCVAIGLLYLFFDSRNLSLNVGLTTRESRPVARYVGSQACAGCHGQAFEAWKTSDHALAMQPASAETML